MNRHTRNWSHFQAARQRSEQWGFVREVAHALLGTILLVGWLYIIAALVYVIGS